MGGTFSKSKSAPSSRTSLRPNNAGQRNNTRVVQKKKDEAEEYLKVLKPKKTNARMEFNPYIPKTLTPRGYAKLQLILSMKKKEYETLCKRLQRERKLWEDPDFPADDSSIRLPELKGKLEWKRAKEINPSGEFFVGGASRFDIEQGALGDCWLLAVIASLTDEPSLFHHVVPKEQKMQSADYAGVFRFRFWRFGMWTEVLVDDRIPVYRGTNKIAFMHSADDNEFWSALMEKAYAKLNGCYFHLSGGSQSEAMEDVTGGVCTTTILTPDKRPKDLSKEMLSYEKRCCLMGCCIDSVIIEEKRADGLIAGHAYSVTQVKTIPYKGQQVTLVRARNPWGGIYEWKGPWSDSSPEWKSVDENTKKALNMSARADGEFWMEINDFSNTFTRLEVCHLGLESLEADQNYRGKRRLEESIFSGEWQQNVNAGGCINNKATFWTNPQFRIDVVDPDPEDDDNMCTVVIGLMQKDTRVKSGGGFLTIGFMVYQIDKDQTTLLSRAQILSRRPAGKSTFSNCREVTATIRLKPGSYVIVPSTFKPNEESKFIVRVFTQVAVKEDELDDQNTVTSVPDEVTEAVQMEEMILNERPDIEQKFKEICDKKTGSITAVDLKKLLNESTLQDIKGFRGFSREMCRSMVASVDHNLTGQLELPEFLNLWDKAKTFKAIFLKHDVDESGFFQANEYREALNDAGYQVSNKLFNALVHRYSDAGADKIPFEDFMLSLVRLHTAFEVTDAHPKNENDKFVFNKEDYLRFAAYI